MPTLHHGGSIQPHSVDIVGIDEIAVCSAQGGNG